MDSEVSDSSQESNFELPDILETSQGRLLKSKCSVGRKKPGTVSGSNDQEGIDGEYSLEAVTDIEWDELALVMTVKWKHYPIEDNTKEKLSSLVSLQAVYKYLTEVNINEESECFKIFAGLHKPGFRFHSSDDRFFFCVKKADFLRDESYRPYRRVFDSVKQRDELLHEYNSRLQKLQFENQNEGFLYKVVNEEDLAMPPPYFQVDIMDRNNNMVDELPYFNPPVRREMAIIRNQGTWCLRTECALAEGTILFNIEGKNIAFEELYEHMKVMGELSCFSHFIYLGKDEETHWSIDRRNLFDAVSCIAHSCDPNCKMDWNGVTAKVVTRRKIEKGEEISLDYFSGNKEKKTKHQLMKRIDGNKDVVECACLSDNCRIVLWTENLADEMYYSYPKEEKLLHNAEDIKYWTNDSVYKGVCFNTE